MITKINHVAVAVEDLDEAIEFYEKNFDLEIEGKETIEEQGVEVALISVGESRIELLQAIDPEGPVARFIQKRGEGIHHIALEVDDIEETLQRMRGRGVRIINEKPKIGAHGMKIAFLHPRSAHGALIELCERDS